jgi:lyso-ornithine lipid O-acyltransferase
VNLRAARRAVTLGLALTFSILYYWLIRLRGPLSLETRARWLNQASRGVLRSLGVRTEVIGTPPLHGLVVSNHLSYLDIAIFSAAMPCFFVAKAEIAVWPYFGEAARVGGTIFIERASLSSADKAEAELTRRLPIPIPILFFPEGTSSDGSAVLRFNSRLFEPAVRSQVPVTTAALRYRPASRGVERDLCWYGDQSFLPHLWKTLGTEGFTAQLRFGRARVYSDRRTAALETHEEVEAMRDAGSGPDGRS